MKNMDISTMNTDDAAIVSLRRCGHIQGEKEDCTKSCVFLFLNKGVSKEAVLGVLSAIFANWQVRQSLRQKRI